jgi:hypothetical protein
MQNMDSELAQTLPTIFPSLPIHSQNSSWSADIMQAHEKLSSSFNSACCSLKLDDSDYTRLQTHLHVVVHQMVPLVEALALIKDTPLPSDFIETIALITGSLVVNLHAACERSQAQ